MTDWTPDPEIIARFRALLDKAQDCVEDLLWILKELECYPQAFPPTQPPSHTLGVFTHDKLAWLENLRETLIFLAEDLPHAGQ